MARQREPLFQNRHTGVSRRAILGGLGAGTLGALAGCIGDDEEIGISAEQDAYEDESITALLKEGYESEVIVQHSDDFTEMTGTSFEVNRLTEAEAHDEFVLSAAEETEAFNFSTIQHWFFPQYDQNEWLRPLDDLLEDHRADWLDFDYDDIMDPVLEPFTSDGTVYGIPHSLISGMFFYREDIFEDLGIDEPETTADVLEAAEIIEDSDYDIAPFLTRGSADGASFGSWAGWAWGYEARVLDDDGNVTVDTPEMHDAVEDLVTLMRDYGPPGAAGVFWTDIPSYVFEDDVAMVFDTSGWGGAFHGERDDMRETLITGPAGIECQWLYAEALGIPSWIPDDMVGPAWQMIQWRMSNDVMIHEIELENRFDIPHEGLMASSEYEDLAEEMGMVHHTEVLQESFESLDDTYWPYVEEFGELGTEFMIQMSDAVDGEQTAAEAVENAQDALEGIFD